MSIVVRNPLRADAGDPSTGSASSESPPSTRPRAGPGCWRAYINPIYTGARVCGTAVTVSVPPDDNWMLHVAVEQCREGDVLVVASRHPLRAGYFGELLATALRRERRSRPGDRRRLPRHRRADRDAFPGVVASAFRRRARSRNASGRVNVPVTCAGAKVEPGDVVVGDDDGVVIVPRAEAASVLAAAKLREEKEARSRERYQRGELSLDVNDMRADLASLGLRYVDYEDAGR